VSRWKPARSKKKADQTAGSTGRLLSCAFIVAFGLFLLYLLFTALLK
jgi:hypothetical protein